MNKKYNNLILFLNIVIFKDNKKKKSLSEILNIIKKEYKKSNYLNEILNKDNIKNIFEINTINELKKLKSVLNSLDEDNFDFIEKQINKNKNYKKLINNLMKKRKYCKFNKVINIIEINENKKHSILGYNFFIKEKIKDNYFNDKNIIYQDIFEKEYKKEDWDIDFGDKEENFNYKKISNRIIYTEDFVFFYK